MKYWLVLVRRPPVAVVAAVAAHLRPTLSLGLNSRDGAPPRPSSPPALVTTTSSSLAASQLCLLARAPTTVVAAAAAAAAASYPSALFPELNSGDGAGAPLASLSLYLPTLSSPLLPATCAFLLRCCTLVVVAAVAVFLR